MKDFEVLISQVNKSSSWFDPNEKEFNPHLATLNLLQLNRERPDFFRQLSVGDTVQYKGGVYNLYLRVFRIEDNHVRFHFNQSYQEREGY